MANKARAPVADRNQQLGRIHQAKKALSLDEETYRCLLERVTGLRSSADMSTAQRNDVLREFARLGFKADEVTSRKRVFAGKPKGELSPLMRKCEALLADGKKPWAYVHAMAERMFNVKRVEWLRPDQLHKLVAALQVDANRNRKDPA